MPDKVLPTDYVNDLCPTAIGQAIAAVHSHANNTLCLYEVNRAETSCNPSSSPDNG